jgi:hypothetical protein
MAATEMEGDEMDETEMDGDEVDAGEAENAEWLVRFGKGGGEPVAASCSA